MATLGPGRRRGCGRNRQCGATGASKICNPRPPERIEQIDVSRKFEVSSKARMSLLGRSVISLLLFSLPAFAGSSVQGIRNFHPVDNHVYRGGQPTGEGFQYLAKMGVKTILNLREADQRSAKERQLVTSLGMQYVSVPMSGLTPPTQAQITRILTLLEGATTGAVFVHCKRGADRTGVVIAAYRIDHDHWDNARALREAMSLGMSFFQLPRESYIRSFHPGIIEAKTVTPTTAVPAVAIPAPAVH